MKLRIKIFAFLTLLGCSYSYGQMREYTYKRRLEGISQQWHKIVLPNDIFGKISHNASDVRIFGITANNDTIEAPYLLNIKSEKISIKEVVFKALNTTHNDKGYYFTFEIPTTESINQINVEFRQKNYDWQLKLEGSQDQQEWFTLLENYRILSIKNESTDFQFNQLNFPSSKYRFYRLIIDTKENPDLTVARISQRKVSEGKIRDYPIEETLIKQNRRTRQTEIDIKLESALPVSYIKLNVKDTFDYYRPLTIKYLSDSFKTEHGWKYNYNTLNSEILNSLEDNSFKCSTTTLQKLKILIENHNNQPLSFNTMEIKGNDHELAVRFTKPATYFLVYGRKGGAKPGYDIERFPEKIPTKLTALQLGEELSIKKESISIAKPLFKNKAWLWAIIIGIILLLGWFSIKMIKKA